MIYINNKIPTHINLDSTEIKKLYYQGNIVYWSLQDKIIDEWEEISIHKQSWSVDLNNQWQLATVRQDADTHFETYQSFSNYNVNNGWARMKVNISTGVTEFTLHYGSYAESNYDYTLIGNLDANMSTSTSTSTGTTSTTWKATSSGKQSSSAPNLIATYTISDPTKEHFIWIAYRKDGSVNSNDDRGYVSFDKTLNVDIDGFRKKVYDYSPNEIEPYVYVFNLTEKWAYSEDKETIIYYGPITATTEILETRFVDGEDDDTFIFNQHIWTKRFYQVKLNNEWLTTEYYTFGDDIGEITNYTFANITNEKYDPSTYVFQGNEYFVIKASPDTTQNRYLVQSNNNTLSGSVVSQTATNIGEFVWHLEKADNNNNFYIVNENGYYWKYTSRSVTYMPLTNDKSLAAKIKIAKGVSYNSYTNNYAFQEQMSGNKYGLNNLNSYNYEYNWYTTQNVFTTTSDGNVYFDLYKVK